MNMKKCIFASLVVFIFIVVFEWIFHGVIMKEAYRQTAFLWRSPQEMSIYMPWMLAGQFLFSFFFTVIFTKGYESKGPMEGVRYGVLIAMLFIASMLIGYAVTPYPNSMITAWIAATLIELSTAGVILAWLYKSKG